MRIGTSDVCNNVEQDAAQTRIPVIRSRYKVKHLSKEKSLTRMYSAQVHQVMRCHWQEILNSGENPEFVLVPWRMLTGS